MTPATHEVPMSMTSVAAALLLQSSPSATWTVDPGHSELGFRVRHMMVSSTRGRFDRFSGKLELDEQDVTRSKVEIEIEAASVNTNLPTRDDHLRSPDFLDVARYPTLTFRSTRVERRAGELIVTGDLTLHGVTRQVTLRGPELAMPVRDPWGNLRVGTRASTVLSRKAFGLKWNLALEAGGLAVGDEVELTLEVEFTRPVAKG